MIILGITDTHDTGAALVKDGRIVAAVNEERLTRVKLETSFPLNSVKECFRISGIKPSEVNYVAIAGFTTPSFMRRINPALRKSDEMLSLGDIEKLGVKMRLWKLYRKAFPEHRGRTNFLETKISVRAFRKHFEKLGIKAKIFFIDHHISHAASAHYTSGLRKSLVITADGAGDGLSATVNLAENGIIKKISETDSRNSVGNFYGRVTEALGFKRNRHEGKTTGLAAHGNPKALYEQIAELIDVDVKKLKFKTKYDFLFNYKAAKKVHAMGHLNHADLAAATQIRCEDIFESLVEEAVKKTGCGNLTLAGGVFANVRINQRILETSGVKSVFIHPHMGDGGIGVGAALELYSRLTSYKPYKLDKGVYFGAGYNDEEIERELKNQDLKYSYYKDVEGVIAEKIAKKKIVGRFNGRMEYGPRALGNRSILADPTDKTINDWLNKRLHRTEFMPFAPSALEEGARKIYKNYEKGKYPAKFMTITFNVTEEGQKMAPAVSHIDGTERPQVVGEENPSYFKILKAYKKITGIPLFVNTSFNAHEEPIVCSPLDAINSFKKGAVDVLALGNYVVESK